MEQFKLQELGDSVGWVSFDPYEYEYSGDSENARKILEAGPPETVRIGEDMSEEVSEELTEELSEEEMHLDTVEETTLDEKRKHIHRNLRRVGVVVESDTH